MALGINVGGQVFRCSAELLLKHSNTLLAKAITNPKICKYDGQGNIYFDRNFELFNYILDYYRTDVIVYPKLVCKQVFRMELAFWQIPVPYVKVKLKHLLDLDRLKFLLMEYQFLVLKNNGKQSYKYTAMLDLFYTMFRLFSLYVDDNYMRTIPLPYYPEGKIYDKASAIFKVLSYVDMKIEVIEVVPEKAKKYANYSFLLEGKLLVRKVRLLIP